MLIELFKSILGNSGALAMERLLKTEIAPYLIPRVIVSWLRNESFGSVNIPCGCPLQSLSKSLKGYSGSSKFGELDYSFEDSDEKHVAAIIAVSLSQNISTSIPRDIDLAKLAKT